LPARKAEVQASYLDWRDQADDAAKKKFFDVLIELNRDPELIDDATLKQQTRAALEASRDAAKRRWRSDADIAALTGLACPNGLRPKPC